MRHKLSTLGLVTILALAFSTNAQKRRALRSPTPKTETEIAVEKEVPMLKHLSDADKTIIRDGIRTLDYVIRLTLLNGFTVDVNKEYDADKIIPKIQLAVDMAAKKLPKSVFSRSLNISSLAWIESQLAYIKAQSKVDESFLSLMDKYGLRNAVPEKVPSEILNIARININMAVEMCRRANIL